MEQWLNANNILFGQFLDLAGEHCPAQQHSKMSGQCSPTVGFILLRAEFIYSNGDLFFKNYTEHPRHFPLYRLLTMCISSLFSIIIINNSSPLDFAALSWEVSYITLPSKQESLTGT